DIRAYSIEGNSLNKKVKLFSSGKTFVDRIRIYFRCDAWVDHNFQVKDDGTVLLVPYVDGNEEITERDKIYEFDGEHFMFKRLTKK
ncbi:MAG: hypothetical protein ACHQM6_05515, partial [Candidatus Kapaibacterium sp.]